jgi:FkbM family methyltransferase
VADKTVAFRPFPEHTFSITGSESDAGVVGELERSGGFYQRDLATLLRGRLPADAVVADVGAHIGVVTVLLAGLCPKGHVYSFEPVAENHAHLTANIAANGLDNVTALRAAVFDTDGEINLEYDAVYPGGSHVGRDGSAVASIRFDTWARSEGLDRLDLVKLDVEGVELAVLGGAAETLRRFRPLVVVECNPVALHRFGGTGYAALLHRLRRLYPVVGVIGPGGNVTPLASERHLRLMLGERGVVDLVCQPAVPLKEVVRQRLQAVAALTRLMRRRDRERPSVQSFVVDAAGIRLRPTTHSIAGAPGEILVVEVEISNGPYWWLSSELVNAHPINVSYRWLDETGVPTGIEGRRSGLTEPLAPGGSTAVGVTVELPGSPGRFTLVLTLVQEHFTWFDDLDPGCTARLLATVAAPTGPGA